MTILRVAKRSNFDKRGDAASEGGASIDEKISVLLGGGISRGTDGLKAGSIGVAPVVAAGRTHLRGLATAGAAGVKQLARDRSSFHTHRELSTKIAAPEAIT